MSLSYITLSFFARSSISLYLPSTLSIPFQLSASLPYRCFSTVQNSNQPSLELFDVEGTPQSQELGHVGPIFGYPTLPQGAVPRSSSLIKLQLQFQSISGATPIIPNSIFRCGSLASDRPPHVPAAFPPSPNKTQKAPHAMAIAESGLHLAPLPPLLLRHPLCACKEPV